MDTAGSPDSSNKRKRSPSEPANPPAAPAAKISKTGANSLSINYLARATQEDLPLIKTDDTFANILQLLGAYSNVLDRHESLASNLGARPLGPILIKRFERCFESPPKVVASHHRNATLNAEESGHTITWLEVIEFARSHPSQFTLSTFSEGKRVCQFYYPQKQLRVQISEEDFLFINSGRCQELIPPLPIWEDEEKEVGTCDVLEAKLKELTNIADMVAARTRQLSHRLKGRRAAILERRAEGGSGTPAKVSSQQMTTAPPSATGVTAVAGADGEASTQSFAAVKVDLLKHFESLPQNQASQARPHSRHHSLGIAPADHNAQNDHAAESTTSSLSPVPLNLSNDPLSYYVSDSTSAARASQATTHTQHRPSVGGAYNTSASASKHNFSRPLPPALESTQPFRPLCQAHMDSLPRGQRVIPPCDRCRRLRMDCVKNLTSCAGCTKKHARCHWRDVTREELGDLDHLMDSADVNGAGYAHEGAMSYANGAGYDDSDDDDSNPLEDLEALGEKEERREKELEEQAKEDEEGLEAARELARQGMDESLRSTGAMQEPHEKTMANAGVEGSSGNGASESVDGSKVNGDHTTLPSSTHVLAKAGSGGPEGPDAAPLVSSDPAFVPLPPQTEPAYSGFHAVNGAASGGAWRATTAS